MINLTKINQHLQVTSINFYSYLVGVTCIVMILINIWYCKEILTKVKIEYNKTRLLLNLLYVIGIIFVSFILLFLAIQCFFI